MRLLIKNGLVINPAENQMEKLDILVEDGVIQKKEKALEADAEQVIDAEGCYVMPGLIDLHVHFRDPGQTYKEDIATGSAAAAAGGFTTVCCMPNTTPVVDSPETVQYIVEKAKKVGLTNVLPVGAVTKGMLGKEVNDFVAMKEAGICAISEDGKSVMNSAVYRKAMKEAARLGLPVMAHCEDINLVEGGVMNMDAKAEALGVKGISNAVEDIIAARDIMLAKETGARLHLCHCSTRDSVTMIREAKEAGIDVTGEVCPHHFSMCTEDITANEGNFKMNPPLREREDMETLIQGLHENVMDVISTDHAPHSAEEKNQVMEKAPFGIVGLETSVALTMTNLVKTGKLTPMQMAEKMSYNPAKVLGIDKGTLNEGKIADIVVIDPDETYVVDVNQFRSKGKNTPFGGTKVSGKVKYTILNGKVVFRDAE
ncbi:MAG: dihydroorotase [Eubacterium sp.]|nr:dihydroorotase [Eubacterium sp.]